MIDQQTLTTVLSVLAAFIGVAGYLHAIKQDLTSQITGVESRMADRIDRVESTLTMKIEDVKADVVDVRADVLDVRAAVRVLEQRTFEMVHRGTTTDAGRDPT